MDAGRLAVSRVLSKHLVVFEVQDGRQECKQKHPPSLEGGYSKTVCRIPGHQDHSKKYKLLPLDLLSTTSQGKDIKVT